MRFGEPVEMDQKPMALDLSHASYANQCWMLGVDGLELLAYFERVDNAGEAFGEQLCGCRSEIARCLTQLHG